MSCLLFCKNESLCLLSVYSFLGRDSENLKKNYGDIFATMPLAVRHGYQALPLVRASWLKR